MVADLKKLKRNNLEQKKAVIQASTRLVKAETSKSKQELKVKEFEQKQKERSSKKWQELKKLVSKPITSKAVVKQTKATLHIKEQKAAEYVPLYFQAELNKTKQDMGFWK
jgi:chromosome condensin MukBEF ATPase and DNA-binding subunit MukB